MTAILKFVIILSLFEIEIKLTCDNYSFYSTVFESELSCRSIKNKASRSLERVRLNKCVKSLHELTEFKLGQRCYNLINS